uniref:Uncharacterized protein n=1 Tax=Leersia perrieri TaxID=77586 RepID=A0A0D9XYY8_9ORYZ
MEGAERDRALIFSPSAAAARTGALANLFGCTSSLGSSRSGYPNPPMHTPPTHREEWQNPKLINDREMERSLCHPHLLAGNQFFIFGF